MKISTWRRLHRTCSKRSSATQSPNIDRYLAEDGRIDFIFLQKHSSLQAVAARELFTNGDHYGRVSDHTGYCIEFEPN